MITLIIPKRLTTDCADLAVASDRYCAERDASGEGGSTFPEGAIHFEGGGCAFARVSYNGRVWLGVAGGETGPLLFDSWTATPSAAMPVGGFASSLPCSSFAGRHTPLDTPSLDTSFHDHEKDVGDDKPCGSCGRAPGQPSEIMPNPCPNCG